MMSVRTHRFSRDLHWELGAFLDYGQHGTAQPALRDRYGVCVRQPVVVEEQWVISG